MQERRLVPVLKRDRKVFCALCHAQPKVHKDILILIWQFVPDTREARAHQRILKEYKYCMIWNYIYITRPLAIPYYTQIPHRQVKVPSYYLIERRGLRHASEAIAGYPDWEKLKVVCETEDGYEHIY